VTDKSYDVIAKALGIALAIARRPRCGRDEDRTDYEKAYAVEVAASFEDAKTRATRAGARAAQERYVDELSQRLGRFFLEHRLLRYSNDRPRNAQRPRP
jgi:hypothetical protein